MLNGYEKNINPYNAYNTIIREYFDITDKRTRDILLNINEADQEQILGSLASKLYKNIVDKVPEIDYGKIPESRGDITKIPNYQEMMECLDTIGDIITYYKEKPDSVNIIREAVDNLRDSRRLWEKAYNINCEFPMLFYNSIALAIVSSVSLLLSTCIDYINKPDEKTFEAILDRNRLHKSKDTLLLKNLAFFNKSYKKKEIDKAMGAMLKAEKAVAEGASTIVGGIVAGIVVVKMILLVIPILHELVYMFYSAKQSLSDFFEMQANVVALNAEKVKEGSTKTPEKRDKIYERQMRMSQLFRKIANKTSIKFNKAEVNANKMIKGDEKPNYNIDDVTNEEPDSYSNIF